MTWLRQTLLVLLHVHDSPHRIALAFGIGVFIAFFPLLGIHTLLALGIAFAFRLSRAAVLLGTYLNNPWTLVPLYTAGIVVGCWLLGIPLEGLPFSGWHHGHGPLWRALFEAVYPYLWPYVVGNLVLGVLGGTGAYLVVRFALERRQRGSH
jgi:hypothetical protein